MKKKGLIISTVVMVVVLIASLTTATYAWFTAVESVKVNTIQLSVKSNANVNVGVKVGSTSTTNDYMYETISRDETDLTDINQVKWTGGTTGLGSVLTFNDLQLGSKNAIGAGTVATGSSDNITPGTVDSSTNVLSPQTITNNKIIQAPAKSSSSADPDLTKVELAKANVDYLDATIGVEANQNDVKGMFAKVVVKTKDSKATLGMNAAVHFIFSIGSNKYDIEPFGTGLNYKTTKNEQAATTANAVPNKKSYVTYDSTAKQLTATFYVWISTSDTAFATGGAAIKDFRIMAYLAGADADCNSNAIGTSCDIDISFDGTKDITKIDDNTTITGNSTIVFINTTDSVKATA